MTQKFYGKCQHYRRGKTFDRCFADDTVIEKKNSTMCRKNPENCHHNKRQRDVNKLGDFIK